MAKGKVHPTVTHESPPAFELHVMAKGKVHPTKNRCLSRLRQLHVMAKGKVHPTERLRCVFYVCCMSWQKERYIQQYVLRMRLSLRCMSWQKEGCYDLERLDRERHHHPKCWNVLSNHCGSWNESRGHQTYLLSPWLSTMVIKPCSTTVGLYFCFFAEKFS